MKRETAQKQATPPEERDRTPLSIVVRLGAGFFFEMLGIFLALDVVLCVAAAFALAGRAEREVRLAVGAVSQNGFPDASERFLLRLGGVTVEQGAGDPAGVRIPGPVGRLFFDRTVSAERYLILPPAGGTPFVRRLDGLVYRADVTGARAPYTVSVAAGDGVRRARSVFGAALIAELILLVFSLRSRARRIRRTLRPISELAETARTLNRAGSLTPKEMEAIAGKINGINASRLDTRIAVSSTQKELRNLADAINGMLDRIDESYRAQVRFVSDASHELRTPIAVIQGYASLLDRWGKSDPKALQESIDAIKSETDNMKLLVEQLLFLARGDNNTMILQMKRFDAALLAEQVFREMKMIDGGHEYRAQFSAAFVEADEALIKQALRVLVDNAVKYTPAGGDIRISTGRRDGRAVLTVQDDGIGIPPEAVPRVFDRFFRTDESRARATGGSGLGLSIAEWIAERHGGHMEVLSREKIGTRISIILPLSEQKTEPEA